jgi:bacterioferritin-associated ferredoxin
MVTENEIKQFIRKGAVNIEDIKQFTGAGTSCGRCHSHINLLLSEAKTGKNKYRLF